MKSSLVKLLFFSSLFLSQFFKEIKAEDSYLLKFYEIKNKSLETSPELKISKARLSEQSAASYTAMTTHLPNANLVLKQEKDFFENRKSQLRALGLSNYDSSWAINYEWPLLNFAQIQSTRKVFAEKEKTKIDSEIKSKEFPIAFTNYFLNYMLAQYKTAAVLNSLKKAETAKKEAQIGFDLGQKTKIDVLRSDANYVSLNSKKTSYKEDEQNSKNQFLEYSGLTNADLEFFSSMSENNILEFINSLTNVPMSKNLAQVERSPNYQRLLLEEKINKLSLAELTRKEYPDLRIQGALSHSANSFAGTLHNPSRAHSVALVLTIPLFSGGSLASSEFQSYFTKKEIEYTINQKKYQLENTLESTRTKISALETLVESLTLNVSQYEELYKLTSKSYQLGKSSLFELLEVQDNLLDSKINLAQNKINLFTLSQNYIWQAGL